MMNLHDFIALNAGSGAILLREEKMTVPKSKKEKIIDWTEKFNRVFRKRDYGELKQGNKERNS